MALSWLSLAGATHGEGNVELQLFPCAHQLFPCAHESSSEAQRAAGASTPVPRSWGWALRSTGEGGFSWQGEQGHTVSTGTHSKVTAAPNCSVGQGLGRGCIQGLRKRKRPLEHGVVCFRMTWQAQRRLVSKLEGKRDSPIYRGWAAVLAQLPGMSAGHQ